MPSSGSSSDVLPIVPKLRDPLRLLRRILLWLYLASCFILVYSFLIQETIGLILFNKALDVRFQAERRQLDLAFSGRSEVRPVGEADLAAAQRVTLADLRGYMGEHLDKFVFQAPIMSIVVFILGLPVTYLILRLLPKRETNAFYLRSFRNDPATLPIRRTIQRALGYKQFRLSGIRDPRRRGSPFLRGLNVVVLAIRYSTPKYMDLEAGDDWKARLWRSLGEARCAFVDVTDLTPFVAEEIGLAMRCLGPQRVLFIGDRTQTYDEWRRRVAEVSGVREAAGKEIQLAIWAPSREDRRAFADRVRQFASALPDGPAGISKEVLPLVRDSIERRPAGRTEEHRFWLLVILGMLAPALWGAMISLLGVALGVAIGPSPAVARVLTIILWAPLVLILLSYLYTIIMYMIERGFD
jgi:hypothetical protein